MQKREWVYVMDPAEYEIECDHCDGTNIAWSEFKHMIWCYDCKIDTKGFGRLLMDKMKYILTILIVILITGCTNKQVKYDIQNLKTNTRDLLEYEAINTRQLVWLINQDEIKKMRPTYPEDIELIQPVLKQYWEDDKILWVPYIINAKEYELLLSKRFLIPVPMYENEKNGRLYLLFDPNKPDNDFLIQVNQEKVTLIPKEFVSRLTFLKQWKKAQPWIFRDINLFKGSYILQMLHKY